MTTNDAEVTEFYVPGRYRPEQGIGTLMRTALASLRSHANARMAQHDLTFMQWVPLYMLVLRPGSTVASLARELDMDPGAMTRALDRLEAKGLVVRVRSSADRRVVHLQPTEEGKRLSTLTQSVVAGVLNEHLRGFTVQEWQQLTHLLTRLLANGQAMKSQEGDGA